MRVSRLLVVLFIMIQGLKRVQGFKGKRILHKNHKKRELAVLVLSRLLFILAPDVTTYESVVLLE